MSIDIVRAIKSPWQKDGGLFRMFLGGLVYCIPFLGFIAQGYLMEYLKKVSEGEEKLGNIFEHGAKSFVIGFKYFIGFMLILIPFIIFTFVLGLLVCQNSQILTELILQIFNIVLMIFITILSIIFTTDFKIESFLNLNAAMSLIKENPVKFVIALVFSFVVQLIYTILAGLIGVILAILGPIFAKIPLIAILLVVSAIFFLGVFIFASLVSTMNILGQYAYESSYIKTLK